MSHNSPVDSALDRWARCGSSLEHTQPQTGARGWGGCWCRHSEHLRPFCAFKSPRGLVKMQILMQRVRGPRERVCISSKLPGEGDAASVCILGYFGTRARSSPLPGLGSAVCIAGSFPEGSSPLPRLQSIICIASPLPGKCPPLSHRL